jgi:hypothetical protein
MTVMAVGSDTHNIFAIGDVLAQRGWHFDRQEGPPAIHLMVSPRHALVVDEFLADLRQAVASATDTSVKTSAYGDDVSAEAAGQSAS